VRVSGRTAGGKVLGIVKPLTFASRVLEITGTDQLLTRYETREAALTAVPELD
jgi:hypothetical protein